MTTTSSTTSAERKTEETLAEKAARESTRVLDMLREKRDAVVDTFQPRIDAVSTFARNDPTKAVLAAAATGAALMGLIGLLSRTRRSTTPGGRAMASIRDAALDLADRAHVAATDAIGSAHQRATAAQQKADDLHSRAGALAEGVGDSWQALRDQAAPVIDRFRPQIDAVTAYAKDDPVRAALGVTTAAAILFGLLSMTRR